MAGVGSLENFTSGERLLSSVNFQPGLLSYLAGSTRGKEAYFSFAVPKWNIPGPCSVNSLSFSVLT